MSTPIVRQVVSAPSGIERAGKDPWPPGAAAPLLPHELPEHINEQIDWHRKVAIRQALDLIADGRKGRALFVLVRSIEAQARVAGIDTVVPRTYHRHVG